MLELINENFSWMIYNSLLALIPVFLGWLVYSIKHPKLKILLFIAWLAFIPNTIYVFTDILHLIKDIRYVNFLGAVIILLQYSALFLAGFATYIMALYPIEKTLKKIYKKSKKNNVTQLIIGINFLIGFGIVLGRVYRLNSWDIVFNTASVNHALRHLTMSPEMIILAILFGLFANFLYFLFKDKIVKILHK